MGKETVTGILEYTQENGMEELCGCGSMDTPVVVQTKTESMESILCTDLRKFAQSHKILALVQLFSIGSVLYGWVALWLSVS